MNCANKPIEKSFGLVWCSWPNCKPQQVDSPSLIKSSLFVYLECVGNFCADQIGMRQVGLKHLATKF